MEKLINKWQYFWSLVIYLAYINISTDIHKQQTILEVVTLDRPGLLARIGLIFMEHGVNLQNARIATLGERVEDVFFITDADNQRARQASGVQRIGLGSRNSRNGVGAA